MFDEYLSFELLKSVVYCCCLLLSDGIETHVERAANDVVKGRGELGMAVRYKVSL